MDLEESPDSLAEHLPTLPLGIRVVVKRTPNVIDRFPHQVGQTGVVSELPVHPNTWIEVQFPDGNKFRFRRSALKLADTPGSNPPTLSPKRKPGTRPDLEQSPSARVSEEQEERRARERARESGKLVLTALDAEEWVGQVVRITAGLQAGHKGRVLHKGNGWVQLLTNEGEINKRAYELELVTDEADADDYTPPSRDQADLQPAGRDDGGMANLDSEDWVGKSVRIVAGPLQGWYGKVFRKGNGWVGVHTLEGEVNKRAHELEILPSDQVDPADYTPGLSRDRSASGGSGGNGGDAAGSPPHREAGHGQPRPRRNVTMASLGAAAEQVEGEANEAHARAVERALRPKPAPTRFYEDDDFTSSRAPRAARDRPPVRPHADSDSNDDMEIEGTARAKRKPAERNYARIVDRDGNQEYRAPRRDFMAGPRAAPRRSMAPRRPPSPSPSDQASVADDTRSIIKGDRSERMAARDRTVAEKQVEEREARLAHIYKRSLEKKNAINFNVWLRRLRPICKDPDEDSEELALGVDLMPVRCRDCAREMADGDTFCWNRECISSPIYRGFAGAGSDDGRAKAPTRNRNSFEMHTQLDDVVTYVMQAPVKWIECPKRPGSDQAFSSDGVIHRWQAWASLEEGGDPDQPGRPFDTDKVAQQLEEEAQEAPEEEPVHVAKRVRVSKPSHRGLNGHPEVFVPSSVPGGAFPHAQQALIHSELQRAQAMGHRVKVEPADDMRPIPGTMAAHRGPPRAYAPQHVMPYHGIPIGQMG